MLTENGRAVAAVVALSNADAETIPLSTNLQFLALIDRSRRRHKREGGMASAELRTRLGMESPPESKRKRRRRKAN